MTNENFGENKTLNIQHSHPSIKGLREPTVYIIFKPSTNLRAKAGKTKGDTPDIFNNIKNNSLNLLYSSESKA